MKDYIIRVFVLFSSLLLMVGITFAGTTGKISGTVLDKKSGDPLIGVNITVEGERTGAATDLDGRYFIINLAPGVYTLKFSSLGYAIQEVENVRVEIDKTTTINVKMTESVLEGKVVTIVAKKPIIEVDRTFATSTISDQDLAIMPVTRIQEAIDIQAGVVDGHFRGGRSGEVVYMIDGIPVQDVYDNTQATTVNQGVVQELQVISGTFNAEYGQAMSGIVNLVTKEGGKSYNGQFSVSYGDYLTSHDKIFYNIDDIDPNDIRNYEGSLSGPFPFLSGLTFFLNGRFEDNEGWYYGQRRWNSEHNVIINSGSLVAFEPVFGDNSAVPMNPDKNIYLYGKLTYPLSATTKLNLSSLSENRDYKEYDHAYEFVPDGDYHRFRRSRTNMLKSTTALGQSAFFELGYANTYTEYYHYVFKDPYDSRYVHPIYGENPTVTLKFGGNKLEHFRRFTTTQNFQSKLAWQVNPVHYVVTGASFSLNDIFYKQFNIIHDSNEIYTEDPTVPSPIVFLNSVEDESGLNTDSYLYHPVEAAAYVQDKIELENFILNIGLRFDYFDPDGKLLSDPQDPNIYQPLLEDRRAQTLEEREQYWYNKPTPKTQLSPRLGIAYPVSPTGVLHFAYGHFFQRPKYEYLYTNPDFELEPGQTVNTLMGNADLDAEKTISYEFGLQQALTEELAINVSLFQRDIRGLVSSDKIISTYDAGTKYTQYVNRDFAEVRGIVLSLDKRYSNNFSARLDYTYQIAEGNASDPSDAFNATKGNKEPIKQLIPLDWDRRHTVNFTFNYTVPKNWGFSVLATYGSGLPYTSESRGDEALVKVLFENDARKPSYFNVDLNAFKEFPLMKGSDNRFAVELLVRNVFDRLNENDVFKDTGRATYTRDEQINRNLEIPYINTLDEVYNHPEYYSRPREVRLRFRMSF